MKEGCGTKLMSSTKFCDKMPATQNEIYEM